MKHIFSIYILIICAFWMTHPLAQPQYKLTNITDNLGVIWGFDFIDDNKVVMNAKSGEVVLYDLRSDSKTLLTVPIDNLYAKGQGGLLDLQLHPNGYIYMTASREYPDGIHTVLSRFRLVGNQITGFEDIFITRTLEDGGRHFGSRITFDDTYIYFSVGDRGNRDSAQDLTTHNGSIIRIYPDGSIPENNPTFANNGIYTYGHRNPQGLFYDQLSNTLWSIEHGPRGGDELNIIEHGKNYGWPIISYGKEYWAPLSVGEGIHKPGMEQPVYQFTPSIAPSDLLIYRADNMHDGKVISSALKLQHLNIITLKNGKVVSEERILTELGERIRSIKQYGEFIYLTTDSGNFYQLQFVL